MTPAEFIFTLRSYEYIGKEKEKRIEEEKKEAERKAPSTRGRRAPTGRYKHH